MKVEQACLSAAGDWRPVGQRTVCPQLVLVFAGRDNLAEEPRWQPWVNQRWPGATLVGCSTAGEIAGLEVREDTVVATAIELVLSQNAPRSHAAVGIGFYGDHLRVGYGSLGGWDPFGAYRRISRARGNVLYELDGKSALGLYKRYLGEHARDLPASGLFYPLSVRLTPGAEEVVRTILAVSERDQSLTFAGDVPEGAEARFMKANFNRLLDGAAGAARSTGHGLQGGRSRPGDSHQLRRSQDGAWPADRGRDRYNQTMTVTTFLEDMR